MKQRALNAAGWASVGGLAAAATGATPIGVVMVAGVGGALAWRLLRRRPSVADGEQRWREPPID